MKLFYLQGGLRATVTMSLIQGIARELFCKCAVPQSGMSYD